MLERGRQQVPVGAVRDQDTHAWERAHEVGPRGIRQAHRPLSKVDTGARAHCAGHDAHGDAAVVARRDGRHDLVERGQRCESALRVCHSNAGRAVSREKKRTRGERRGPRKDKKRERIRRR